MNRRVHARARWAMGALALLSACGVPTEQDARAIGEDAVPQGLRPGQTTPADDDGEPTPVDLWFVHDGELTSVRRLVDLPATASGVADELLQGPSAAEQTEGLRSALPGLGVIIAVEVTGGVAMVELSADFAQIPAADQVLAVGQVVLTLTDRPGIGRVAFLSGEAPLAVPLPSGDSAPESVSRDDYVTLAAPGEA